MVSDNWKEYAFGFYHFDGGNPNASLWISGIEPGGSLGWTEFERLLQGKDKFTWRDKNGKVITCWNDNYLGGYEGQISLHHKITGKLLMSVYHDGDIFDERQVEAYCRKRLYRSDGECFRMNFYPLNRSSVDAEWGKNMVDVTGLDSADEYYAWYREDMFPKMKAFFNTYATNVKVILAAGATFGCEFVQLFDVTLPSWNIRHELGRNNRKYVYEEKTAQGATFLLSPALTGQGRGVLGNDNQSIQALASLVREKLQLH